MTGAGTAGPGHPSFSDSGWHNIAGAAGLRSQAGKTRCSSSIIILLLLFGCGGGYYGPSRWSPGGGAGIGLGTG
jgi:hypothetical protein